jgi:hypothetical protein
MPLFVVEEAVKATILAAMSSYWQQQERAVDGLKRVGRGRRRRHSGGGGSLMDCALALLAIPCLLE